LQHTFDLGGNNGDILALVSTRFNTAQYLATDYIPLEHEAAFTVTDLNVTYEPPGGKWSLTGYIRNIENSAVYSNAFEYAFAKNVVVGSINPPRTFGGVFKVHF